MRILPNRGSCERFPVKNQSREPIEDIPLTDKATGRPESQAAPGAHKRRATIGPAEALPLRVLPPALVRVYVPQKRKPKNNRARVLVMDRHPMVEEWISFLMGGEAELVLSGHGTDLADAASLVAQSRPSLIVLEIAKDIPRGLAIVRALKAEFPKLRMLVFSSCDEIAHSVQALRAGARGFVSKTASGSEVLQAIRQVLDERVYLSCAMISHLAAGIADSRTAPKTGPGALLSQRELQVFAFIGEGLRPTEIAQRISLSVKTVESYLTRIREKLKLKNARALFQDAVKWSKAREKADEK